MHTTPKTVIIFLAVLGLSVSIHAQNPRFELVHYPDAPILTPGFQHPFDTHGVADPELVWDGTAFRLYYTATGSDDVLRIAVATSGNLMDWTAGGVVLEPAPDTFDRDGVSDPDIVKVGDRYHMYYTARSANWKYIARVSSGDGFQFDSTRRIVLGPSFKQERFDFLGVGEPSVIYQNGVYQMMYRGFDTSVWWRLGLAISADGAQFTRILQDEEFGANFGRGPHGFDDGGAGEPEIWISDSGNDVRLLYTSNHY
ncbi:MAG TPA: hypothetical protein PLV45_03905 [bacterium]|nr:hypothetical protein [bacterium]